MRKTLFFLFFVLSLLQFRSQNWAAMGSNHPAWGNVGCMYYDSTTNLLYAGGQFDTIDGKRIHGIAKWNGTTWDSLGSGVDSYAPFPIYGPRKILGYKGKIFAFGNFGQAGPYFTGGMGVWNGVSWDSITEFPNGMVYDADVYNDTLYICGNFTQVGSVTTRWAAKFDGTTWYPLDFPYNINSSFTAIRAFNGKVYAAGVIYSNGFGLLAEWDGTTWIPWAGVQGDGNKGVFGLERINNQLFVYGRFWQIGSIWSPGILSWDGNNWYGYGGGVTPTSSATIREIFWFDNKLHVVGGFDYAGGQGDGTNFNTYAVWDGADWCVTADIYDNLLNCISIYNNQICVGGAFWSINGDSSISFVAQWLGNDGFSACGNATGIETLKENKEIKLFPNPASNQITLTSEIEIKSESITVFNSIGQNVQGEVSLLIISPTEIEIDISTMPSGIYFLTVAIDGKTTSKKFIKE